MADFAILSKRTLEVEAQRQRHNWGRDVYPLWNIFRLHYLSGADWKVCCRQLKMDRGSFFHAVYRIEAALGRAYRETQPFSLYPPKEYFQRKPHGETVAPFPAKEEPRFQPLRPPLAPKRPRRVRTIEAPVEVPKRARVRSKLAA